MEVGDNNNDDVLSAFEEAGYTVEDDGNSGGSDIYAHELAVAEPSTLEAEGEMPSSEEGGESSPEQGETPSSHESSEAGDQQPSVDNQMSAEEDYSRFIDEMSRGLYNSKDDLIENQVFEKAEDYDQLVEDYEALEERLKEAENKEPEFVNDFMRNLNEHVRNGGNPEDFIRVQSVKVDELESIDVLRTQMKWNNPDLSDGDIQLLLNEKYKLDEDQFTDEEMRLGAVQMKMDAKQAREQLSQHQHDMSVPTSQKSQEEMEAANTERMNAWDDEIVDMVDDFDAISISINNDLTLNYKVAPEEKEALENEVYEIIEQTGMELDSQEAYDTAREIMRNRYIISHFDDIARALGEKARSMTDEQWHKTAHNPSAIPKGDTPDQPDKPKTVGDVAWDIISKAEGL
jgi:hypothetical protein